MEFLGVGVEDVGDGWGFVGGLGEFQGRFRLGGGGSSSSISVIEVGISRAGGVNGSMTSSGGSVWQSAKRQSVTSRQMMILILFRIMLPPLDISARDYIILTGVYKL